jgi:alanine-alpha-ketoisovalerate/valine-pyruvate aminotransferase
LTDGQFFTFLVDQAAAAPGGVLTPTASEINGVKYDLYTGLETVTDGIQSPLRTSGYVSTLTNPDDLVLNEIYDYFTMKLTTNLKIVNPGQYQFRFVAADDNVQLLIDGVNYMNRTCCGDVTGANITLTAGNHSLEVRFSEYVGGETLQLQWRAAATGLDVTTTWQAIAENKLFLPAAPAVYLLGIERIKM